MIYLLIHLFVYVRIANGLGLNPFYRNIIKLIFLIGGSSFFIYRFLGRNSALYHLDYFSSIWMGIISITFSVFVLQYIFVLIFPNHSMPVTLFFIFLAFFVSGYSFYNCLGIPRIKDIEVPIEGLPSRLEGFSIVQMSDLHLDGWKSEDWLGKVVDKTNEINPDLVVITGDLINQDAKRCERFSGILRQLVPKHGVLAVIGNHESYSGIENFMEFAKDSGITVLRNECITVAEGIEIAGIDDDSTRAFSGEGSNLIKAMEECDANRPVILLYHRPRGFKEAVEMGVDLQLSGHTHAGQIPPMDLIVFMIYKYPYGLYSYKSSYIYTTCGTGTWGPPMRLFSHPEIVKINLIGTNPHAALRRHEG